MKYPVNWDRDHVTRIVIIGKLLSTKYFHSYSEPDEEENLQASEITETYGIFKDNNGNITFVVKTEENIIEKINPDIFTDVDNVNEIVIRGVLFSSNSKEPIPDIILELPKLKSVILESFDSTVFPINICGIKNLEKLRIRGSEFSQIPREVGKLQKLFFLEIARSPINSLPCEIGNLCNLTRLNIFATQIKALPPEIVQLINLTSLSLCSNEILTFQKEICRLHNLKHLDFYYNQIAHLPKEIRQLNKLEELNLQCNPLHIPPEILAKTKEPSAILNYYFSRRKEPLNEIKLIIVGQKSVGKTSLVQRLVYNKFNSSETKTEGVSINYWQVDSQSKIIINLWDFGGEEVMHATHQLFLTKRSLYLLVLDSRLTQEENRVEYWLKTIGSFGGETPTLIVGNITDQHPLDVDYAGLSKKYPNIVGILETSAMTGAGIIELKAAIVEQINKLPHTGDVLPQAWFKIKTKLEKLGRESNSISHEKYLDLCAEQNVIDEISQHALIGFLHDLGVILYFQDNPRLEVFGILNPQWVTTGIYKILNSHALFQNKGLLTASMLDEILNLPEYPPDKRMFIVQMMKKFELCCDIEPDKTFLVPDLLPKDEPAELNFNGVLAFEYAYHVLLSSIITRFIVRMSHRIDDNYLWRTGVKLKFGMNTALVKADTVNHKITIAIEGLEHTRHEALSAIRFQLDDIHKSIKGLNPQKRVPVPGERNGKTIEYDLQFRFEHRYDEWNWLD